MIKAYFIDWMGTLADVSDAEPIKNEFGRELSQFLMIKQLEDIDIPEEEKSKISAKLNSARHWLYDDSQKIAEVLSVDYKLAIVSNMYGITAKQIRELFPNFLEQFDVLTLSAEVGLKKPDPRIFIYTLERLNWLNDSNILPREVMMIGDKKDNDVDPAIELGMQARLIDRTKQNLRNVI